MTCRNCDKGTQHLPWPQEWRDANPSFKPTNLCPFHCPTCFPFDCAACGHPVGEHARPMLNMLPARGERSRGRCALCHGPRYGGPCQ